MGGPKKKSLAQVEKQQRRRTVRETKNPKANGSKFNPTTARSGSKYRVEDLKELASIRALTPYSVAAKYDVKLNEAKNILRVLEARQKIQQVASARGLKIYKVTG